MRENSYELCVYGCAEALLVMSVSKNNFPKEIYCQATYILRQSADNCLVTSDCCRYIHITGDDFGAVAGRVYELSNGRQIPLPTTVSAAELVPSLKRRQLWFHAF
jgi:hypothetical protein